MQEFKTTYVLNFFPSSASSEFYSDQVSFFLVAQIIVMFRENFGPISTKKIVKSVIKVTKLLQTFGVHHIC